MQCQGFDPVEHNVTEFLKFCERLEATEDFDKDDKTMCKTFHYYATLFQHGIQHGIQNNVNRDIESNIINPNSSF